MVLKSDILPDFFTKYLGKKEISYTDSFSGSLVTFREKAYGKNIKLPRNCEDCPPGRVQFRSQLDNAVYRTEMVIKNIYVFSDSAVKYMRNRKLCGVGLLGGATENNGLKPREITIQITPLLIGVGGFSGANPDGWWKFR